MTKSEATLRLVYESAINELKSHQENSRAGKEACGNTKTDDGSSIERLHEAGESAYRFAVRILEEKLAFYDRLEG